MNSRRTLTALAIATTLLASGVAVQRDTRATSADSRPTEPANPATPPTVTADALPTVQIDGVVWNQVVAGDLVFAGGRFTAARPPGAPLGQSETPRRNFLAYDLTTGALVQTIAPAFDAQVRALAVSPAGDRLYVGGDFTSVDGVPRSRLAAFELPSMRLVSSFAPPVGYHVHALTVSPDGSTLYVGGNFDSVGATVRNKLAAFDTASGGLLDWAPRALGGFVGAMTIAPDGTRLVVGGKFTSLNGSSNPGYGLGALDALTGELLPWGANALVRNATDEAAITSLASDGQFVYGSGFTRVTAAVGNLEGAFAASWDGGVLEWVADCHGDHHAVFPSAGVVYAVGHAHFCGNIGGFPQTGGDQQRLWTYQRAVAFSRSRTGTVARNTTGNGYFDWGGSPAPSFLHWYPDLDFGTFTGQLQGPWHITGADGYLVLGGEFEVVNGVPQQGLVRFASASIAPNREGPRVSGTAWTPTVDVVDDVVTATISANWDRDNALLTYVLERDGRVVDEVSTTSTQFDRATLTLTDRSAPGGSAVYRVVAVDPFGNEATSAPVTVTVAAPPTTTAPTTTAPSTTAPSTTAPTTTAPSTTAPSTTAPSTTAPSTTAPTTTSTAPATTTTVPRATTTTTAVTTTTVPRATTTTTAATTTTAPTTTTTVPATTTTMPAPTTTVPSPTTTAPATTTSTTTPPAPAPVDEVVVLDRFSTPTSAGWGIAEVGGAWATDSPTAWFGAADGEARLALDAPGVGAGAFVHVVERDVDVRVTVAVTGTPTGGGTYASLVGRRIGTTDHRAKVRYTATGGLELYLSRASGVSRSDGVEVDLASFVVARSGWDPSRPLRVRLQVTGSSPTTLRAKVWSADAAEPFGWQVVTTDSTPAAQGVGGVGLVAYASSSGIGQVVAVFDDLEARRLLPGRS